MDGRGRPPDVQKDRREQILLAALRVFAAKGYDGATNREIARDAGVTTAALYWYFPSKEEMFKAVIDEHLKKVQGLQGDISSVIHIPPRIFLSGLVRSFLALFKQEDARNLFKILLVEGVRRSAVAAIWENYMKEAASKWLVQYMEAQVERRVFRPVDGLLATQVLMGSAIAFLLRRDLMGHQQLSHVTDDQFIDTLIDTFLRGVLVETDESSNRAPSKPEL